MKAKLIRRAAPLVIGLFLPLMYFNSGMQTAEFAAATTTPLPLTQAANSAPQTHFPGIITGAIIILIVILVGVLLQPKER